MVFYDKVIYCECCKKRVDRIWEDKERNYRYQWAYLFPVCTTEGRRWLCGNCLYAYNILDRLPDEKESLMDRTSLMKKRRQERGNEYEVR